MGRSRDGGNGGSQNGLTMGVLLCGTLADSRVYEADNSRNRGGGRSRNQASDQLRVSVSCGGDTYSVYFDCYDERRGVNWEEEFDAHEIGDPVVIRARPYVNGNGRLSWSSADVINWPSRQSRRDSVRVSTQSGEVLDDFVAAAV